MGIIWERFTGVGMGSRPSELLRNPVSVFRRKETLPDGGPVQFTRREHLDHAVHTVIARLADHLSAPYTADGLAEKR